MHIYFNITFWAILGLIGIIAIGSIWHIYRRIYLVSKNELPLKRKPSEFLLIMGLMISSILDPSSKARIEQADKVRNKKVEPGKENA